MVDDHWHHASLNAAAVHIGDWVFDPELQELSNDDETVRLEPRTSHLLSLLVQAPGAVMQRERLVEAVWSGMVVGDEALTNAVNKLRKALGDDPQNPRYIQTIPKKGYRLIAEVSTPEPPTRDEPLSEPGARPEPPGAKQYRWHIAVIAIAALAGLLLILSPSTLERQQSKTEQSTQISAKEEPPVVVVLPFENLSQDPDQEYFTDGITDDIITDLTRFEGIRVLAGTTTFKLRGQKIDYQQLIDELKISHVLEGSVRKAGDTLRISARLILARDGQSLWAERYDKPLEDIFKVQDDVSRNIANALSVELTEQDKLAFERPTTSNFDAYDLYLQGRRRMDERTPEGTEAALDLFEAAIGLDPDFARAYGAIAVALARTATSASIESPGPRRDRALFYARKAVELDQRSQNTYWALGFTHLLRAEFTAAEAAIFESLRIAPNYADGMALMALLKNYLEQPDEAIVLIEKAMLLNPGYSWDYPYNLGYSYFLKGDYDKAIEYLTSALERNLNSRSPRLILIACYMATGATDDAEWEVEQLLTLDPHYTIGFMQEQIPIRDSPRMNRFVEQLRQAGLPD